MLTVRGKIIKRLRWKKYSDQLLERKYHCANVELDKVFYLQYIDIY